MDLLVVELKVSSALLNDREDSGPLVNKGEAVEDIVVILPLVLGIVVMSLVLEDGKIISESVTTVLFVVSAFLVIISVVEDFEVLRASVIEGIVWMFMLKDSFTADSLLVNS